MTILTSLAIIFLSCIVLSSILKKIHLPPLLGMLIIGIVFGPYVLNILSNDLLAISSSLRKLALIIILTRAGLSFKLSDFKKIGRPALLLCFVPATFEIIGYIIFAPLLLNLSILESALMGCVMGAVSPAVVIPLMLKLQNEKYGTNKSIPQMIMAGASCDDIFVIVLFTSLLVSLQTNQINFTILLQMPVSIILGIIIGLLIGIIITYIFKHFKIRDTIKVIILLSFSFLLVYLEDLLKDYVSISSLLAIIVLAATLNFKYEAKAKDLTIRYEKLWIVAEMLLFVLVGAIVDIKYAMSSSLTLILLLFIALIFRMIGVFVCLIKTNLNIKERLFCMIAYIPKATVQAAIGSIPLSLNLNCGNAILTIAILAILITAPLGSFLTSSTYKHLLSKEDTNIL